MSVKNITSVSALLKSVTVETRTVDVPEMEEGVTVTVRGLRANEVQKLNKLGGKVIIHANESKEFDMSNMKLDGGALLFAMGWVDEDGNNVLNQRHKREFDAGVKELSGLPNSVVEQVAAVVRELTGLDDTDEELEKDSEDFLTTEVGN